MKNLHDVIKIKEAEIARLQKEVDALRTADKLLADDSEKPKVKKDKVPEGTVVTQPLMIRSVLLESGKALHVDDISKAIRRKFGVKFKPLYLTSIIYRIMKKGRLFRKEGKNTFGLLEWPIQQELRVADDMRVQ